MKIYNEDNGPTHPPQLNDIIKKWPFELSPFQINAIIALISGNHALITAHTGSGKTLPAEFAIEHYVRAGKKVIYTSPIKALTNEKFHDLSEKFPDISFGLITGDNKFNPEADVLLMTQEILTNTLTQKKLFEEGGLLEDEAAEKATELLSFTMDIENELACVIMDETHYINDRDRGRVWEEGIMWLPPNIQLLMLSATIAKVEELCELVERRGGPEVWVCPTIKRVVPLTHYGYLTIPASNFKKMKTGDRIKYEDMLNKLHCLKSNSHFNEEQYHKLLKVSKFINLSHINVNRFFVLNEVLSTLKTQNDLPAIIFVFSRKQVNLLASKIQVPLLEEGSKIPSIIEKECESLLRKKLPNYKEYLVLPEYKFIIGLLRKGIAIHHAGVLKEFREMIELIFKKNYIKVLLATETFAVGINMPTRTTVFTSLKKFDGSKFRWLLPSELTQMAGRAGRRGIDSKGKVVYLMNMFRDEPSANTLRHMMTGAPDSIQSKFVIHAGLLLRLISVKNYNFEHFIEQSMLSKELKYSRLDLENQLKKLQIKGEIGYRTATDVLEQLHDLKSTVSMMRGKQKKKRLRDISNLEDSNKFIKQDYSRFIQRLDTVNKAKQIEEKIDNVNKYISREVNVQLGILTQEEFIERNDGEWLLNRKGRISITLHELPSLPFAEVLEKKIFEELDPIEIAGVLSCFTNLHLPEEQSVLSISSIEAPDGVRRAIYTIRETYNKYLDIFARLKLDIVENYEMHYNMCELTIRWCRADNEKECLNIFRLAKSYDIQLGDFVKAILKINNVIKELEKAVIIREDLKLLEKLKQIPSLILKSCITNQSLYL